jgi:integrase
VTDVSWPAHHKPPNLRLHFLVSVNTGLRWSEQMNLRWQDVDMLSRIITIPRAKNGYTRRVPMNSVVQAVVFELGSQRQRPGDPTEPVFACPPQAGRQVLPEGCRTGPGGAQRGGEGR